MKLATTASASALDNQHLPWEGYHQPAEDGPPSTFTKAMKNSLKLACSGTLAVAAVATAILMSQDPTQDFGKHSDAKTISRKLDAPKRPSLTLRSSDLSHSFQASKSAQKAAELAQQGKEAVDGLLNGLQNSSTHEERLIHADALALIGSEKAIRGLLAYARTEPNLNIRAELLNSLKALSNRDSLTVLSAAVTTPLDSRSLNATIEALGRLADSATINELVGKYRSDPTVKTQRGQITLALSSIGSPGTARTLASIARTSPEPGLVEAAARALSKIGNATAAQGLIDTLERIGDSDPTLSSSVSELIRRLDHPEGRSILANLQND